jgi:hemerythrin-like domain-containing protein
MKYTEELKAEHDYIKLTLQILDKIYGEIQSGDII